MTKLDIKDGYSSVPINQLDQKFLEFYFNSTVYQDVPLPNRCTENHRKFTKLLKPPISLLRKVEKIIIADYFGDLMSYTYDTHPKNIGNIIKMEILLDFCGSPNKAFVYTLSQNRIFSFDLDSAWSFLWQTSNWETFFGICDCILAKYRVTMQGLAKILRNVSDDLIGLILGKLHFWVLGRC